MDRSRKLVVGGGILILGLCTAGERLLEKSVAAQNGKQVPVFQFDPQWPKPLPNNWVVGSTIGVAVDSRDHIWVLTRPSTLQPNELRSIWKKAPPVLEFDQQGNLVSSFGGPGPGYEWPKSEHGIYVDYKDNVWIGGGADSQMLKFTRDGKFLLQIGHAGKPQDSNDTANVGGPANMTVDPATNELYVADGYRNHRVIVFDADTGAYKRHWGAYGKKPDDSYFPRLAASRAAKGGSQPAAGRGRGGRGAAAGEEGEGGPTGYDPSEPPPEQFRIVHTVKIGKDGLVYVGDRTNDRIQVFHKDGSFVKEAFVSRKTMGSGSVWDIGFSIDPAQTFIFDPDGNDEVVYILRRDTLEVVASFGHGGHWPGQFYGPHSLAVDSKGNLYITETYEGKRVQRFNYKGMGAPAMVPGT